MSKPKIYGFCEAGCKYEIDQMIIVDVTRNSDDTMATDFDLSTITTDNANNIIFRVTSNDLVGKVYCCLRTSHTTSLGYSWFEYNGLYENKVITVFFAYDGNGVITNKKIEISKLATQEYVDGKHLYEHNLKIKSGLFTIFLTLMTDSATEITTDTLSSYITGIEHVATGYGNPNSNLNVTYRLVISICYSEYSSKYFIRIAELATPETYGHAGSTFDLETLDSVTDDVRQIY